MRLDTQEIVSSSSEASKRADRVSAPPHRYGSKHGLSSKSVS